MAKKLLFAVFVLTVALNASALLFISIAPERPDMNMRMNDESFFEKLRSMLPW